VPRRGVVFLSRALSFWEPHLPWALPRIVQANQAMPIASNRGSGQRAGREPTPCLLKGCEGRFRSRLRRDRYCSAECRQAARKWSRSKAHLRYRATAAGKQKRNGQSRRYRERPEPPTSNAGRSTCGDPEGNPSKLFSITVATAPTATRDSPESGARPTSASIRACRRAMERVWQRERRWRPPAAVEQVSGHRGR
jgi:hypothetical protein